MAGLYAVVLGIAFPTDDGSEPMTGEDIFEGIAGIVIWLAISLGCIWWGDELGEGLVGARFGLVSSAPPGWAVKLMGWIFLSLPAVVVLIWR